MSSRKPGVPFEYFPHTADIGLIARGASLEEAFANAGRGLFDLMIEGDSGQVADMRRVETSGESVEDLLVAWLNDLLFLFDSEGFIGVDFRFIEMSQRVLVAEVRGERFDADRHAVKVGVKAATYHQVAVEADEHWRLMVILDV